MMGVSCRGERMIGNVPFSFFKCPQSNTGKNQNPNTLQVF